MRASCRQDGRRGAARGGAAWCAWRSLTRGPASPLPGGWLAADVVILGFPCNQFGGQEPGTNAEIESFCSTKFGVTFPLFDKIKVNGPNAAPLYEFLKREAASGNIGWNFEKFLIDKNGKVVKHFKSKTTPEDLVPEIQALL